MSQVLEFNQLSPAYKLNEKANNIKTWNILCHGLATEPEVGLFYPAYFVTVFS
jgi:hypothetical protein